ncbi:MAG: hypothetical protein RLZZ156_1689 [Deinococcota bacterium]|jgi:uncharacterized protein
MQFSLLEWVLLGLGALVAGSSKGGLPGINTLAVVFFIQVLPAKIATGALLPLLIVADFVAVLLFRNSANWRELWRIFPSTAVGVVVGALLLGQMNDTIVKPLIGMIILILCALQFWRSKNANAGLNLVQHPVTAASAGTIAGFTTLIANAGGPIMALYLLAMRLPKTEFVGTTAWFFLVVNLFKLPFIIGLGLVNIESLELNLYLIPVVILGVFIGRFTMQKLEQKTFNNLALLLAFLGGLRLLF